MLRFALIGLVACGYPPPATLGGDAGIDATADARVASATVTLQLPRYLDLATSAGWQADVVGPPSAAIHYAWHVSPAGAVSMVPASASSAFDATGKVTLTGMVSAGGVSTLADLELAVTGDAAGSATSTIQVAHFETFGYRAPFAQSSGTTLNAGRVLAIPFTMTSGQRVIAFGLRAASAANVRIGIYGTTGAAPGDLLLASPVISAVAGETVAFLDTPQTIAVQASYLALVSETDLSIGVDASPAGVVTEFAGDIAAGNPLPSPFVQTTSFMGGPTNVFVIAIAP